MESVIARADTRAMDFWSRRGRSLRGLHVRLQTEQWSRLQRGADSTAQPAYPPSVTPVRSRESRDHGAPRIHCGEGVAPGDDHDDEDDHKNGERRPLFWWLALPATGGS